MNDFFLFIRNFLNSIAPIGTTKSPVSLIYAAIRLYFSKVLIMSPEEGVVEQINKLC